MVGPPAVCASQPLGYSVDISVYRAVACSLRMTDELLVYYSHRPGTVLPQRLEIRIPDCRLCSMDGAVEQSFNGTRNPVVLPIALQDFASVVTVMDSRIGSPCIRQNLFHKADTISE